MNSQWKGIAMAASGGALLLNALLPVLPQQKQADGQQIASNVTTNRPAKRIGEAWRDPENPIVKIFHGQRLDLWSLQKPKAVKLPVVQQAAWVRTPVDRFILAALEAKKLTPSREADRRTLIRRLYFGLTGLPPTPEEVKAFVADPAKNAYEKLVERLLASPRYGERWGRHWLDVVRYADTNGFERDEFRPNTYRYRDYVVRAFNADKPYNQFIKEQIAGDEIVGSDKPNTPEEVEKIIATGYMRLGQYDSTGSIFEEDSRGRDQLMGDLVNTTGSAFLGLTVACANCHNHKYDPISQADHFRLRAFFAGVKYRDDISIDPPPVRAEVEKQNAEADAQVKSLEKERDALPKDDKKGSEAFQPRLEEAKKRKRAATVALAMTDGGKDAPATRIFAGGDVQQAREEVAPGFLSVLDPNPATIRPPQSGASTGRRTALAEWIASPANPFTALVMVNRIWQGHFGAGIVATPNDFGYSGARPTNQPLLDWLANEFVRSGWSVKKMHRLMVLSAAYRQASSDDPKRRKIDPDNKLLWRQNIRRHDSDTLRDSLLAVSGLLLPVDGGPPRWPPVQQDLLDAQPSILETHSDEEARKRLEGWYADPVEKTDVRTIFLIQKRCLPVPFLQPFDLQDMAISCPVRTNTTVAPQALTLLNNELTLRAAKAFTVRVVKEAGNEIERQIRRAVWLALSREPDKEELKIARNLLAVHTKKYAQSKSKSDEPPAQMALTDLCRALLNVNEFVYVD